MAKIGWHNRRQGNGVSSARHRPFTGVNCRAVLSDPSQRPSPVYQQTSSRVQVPQTDATIQYAQPAQLYLGSRPLLGGRQVETDAVQKCVELHESWLRGDNGPTHNEQWQGDPQLLCHRLLTPSNVVSKFTRISV